MNLNLNDWHGGNRKMCDLYKLSPVSWAVKTEKEDINVFPSIEEAASHLESFGIPDEEIDNALIEMSAHGHSHANFGTYKTFIFSDNARPNELLGIA